MTTRTVSEPPGPVPSSPAIEEVAKKAPRLKGRRIILGALSLALVVGAGVGVLIYERTRVPVAPFRTAMVVHADITQQVTATGTLQPIVTSPVGAQVSGIVWKLHADYNSQVKSGDLLVELDPALFNNAVASAKAQLAQAQSNMASAQATSAGALIARDRMAGLEHTGIATTADRDASVATFGQTSGLARSAAAQVDQARALLAKANLDLEHSIIRAPVDGTVISRNIDLGQAVAATLTAPTLFTIAQDLHHMQVHAAVDEADIGQVRAGQAATFTVDAFRDQTFAAVVNEVRNAPQTAQNVVTYDVVLDVENPDLELRPGMTANVLILIVQKTQVAAVPNEALRFRPPAAPGAPASASRASGDAPLGAAVYVPDGKRAVRTAVKIGVTDGNMTEVDDLELGREVIVDVVRDKSKPSTGGPGSGP